MNLHMFLEDSLDFCKENIITSLFIFTYYYDKRRYTDDSTESYQEFLRICSQSL